MTKKEQEKFQWDAEKATDISALPTIRDFEDDVKQGYLTGKKRKRLERRQASTGRTLQNILGGKFGW